MLKKRLFSILLCALMLLCGGAFASAQAQYVYDDAALLTAEEAATLDAQLSKMSDTYGMDFIALTTSDTGGKDSKLYCADFFEKMGFGRGVGKDGLVLCIDMDNRQIMLVTHGGLIQVIDDDREESVYDAMYDDVSDGSYYDAFLGGLVQIEEYVQEGPRHGQFTYDSKTGAISGYYYQEDDAYFQAGLASGEIYYDAATNTYYYNQNYTPSLAVRLKRAFTPGGIALGLGAGLIAGLLTVLIIRGSYKKEFEETSYDFHEQGNIEILRNGDTLANKYVTTRVIPKVEDSGSNRSGGGSSGGSGFGSGTFSSSSGGSFGGGHGRSF